MYIVISTLPHFCSILPLISYYNTYTKGYIHIVILSTICSIVYHIYEESNTVINFIDYIFATIWFLYDLYMGYRYSNTVINILVGNSIVFLINIQIPYNTYYQLNHSIWHCMNAYKCYYVATLISAGISKYNRFKNILYIE